MIARWKQKVRAGARFTQTQIVTDLDRFEAWFDAVQSDAELRDVPVLASLPMIGSHRGFEIMAGLPGVHVGPDVADRIEATDEPAGLLGDWVLSATRWRSVTPTGSSHATGT